MIRGLAVLLTFQLVGEALTRVFDLPIPGPVIGMLLLFLVLLGREDTPRLLRAPSEALLRHLALLFVPATVGVVVQLELIADDWLPIVVAVVVGTAVTMAVTALTVRALVRGGDDDAG